MAEEGLYYVKALSVATAGAGNEAVIEIWNPSSVRSIELLELAMVGSLSQNAGVDITTRRISAKGTAGTTVTPAAAHHAKGTAAPYSGFLIYTGFSVEPTLVAGILHPSWATGSGRASGVLFPLPFGIEIPAGQGMAFVQVAAVSVNDSEFGFVVREL